MKAVDPGADACVFCRIVTGDAPAIVVHRDGRVVAFRDIHPVAPIHILIVPTQHIASLERLGDASGGILDHMIEVARLITNQEGVASTGYRLVINMGAEAGQSVHHLHMHLLAGRRMHWPPG